MKIGSRVMCVVNLDMCGSQQIVNGSQGVVENSPESIYGPEDNQALQDTLDEIYGETISLVGRKLIDLGFDVRSDFECYIGE